MHVTEPNASVTSQYRNLAVSHSFADKCTLTTLPYRSFPARAAVAMPFAVSAEGDAAATPLRPKHNEKMEAIDATAILFMIFPSTRFITKETRILERCNGKISS